ncbi:hypothetical protein GCM10009557_14790 [Virgisporangium ochraceum]|uniref:Aminoglycoside phosphotransferase n=1 Tax=Virgisporangium ochraceum TaxID=65505 RepID=A0A8J3ZM69_9ACTN|nr:aminoglycoside phosphotransferase family protein [Virgisporangium ochraceum]GIJ66301.1 hypothetical protein Voc01_012180 [Virgisporangium ochraceum]
MTEVDADGPTDSRLRVPDRVIDGVRLRWPDRAEGWIAAAAAELRELCAANGAKPRTVFAARYGYVVAAETPTGGIVFRSTPDPDGPLQGKVASALADIGAGPRVRALITTATGTWTVMDEARPGTPLPHADRSSLDPVALLAPIRRIVDQPAPAPELPSLIDWLRDRLENDDLADLAPNTTVAPAEQREQALSILDQLALDHVPGLCHGDASGWNLLADDTHGWLLIDPRGVSGEAAYDVAVLAFKFAGNRTDRAIVDLACHLTGQDPERVNAWISIAGAARI